AFLALVLSFMFLLTGLDAAPDLSDEGFLWYGALKAQVGQVPIRDFQAYDPGRYYWTAGWFGVFGHDLLALRLATWLFQALGLFLALLAARRATRSVWASAFMAMLILPWMT